MKLFSNGGAQTTGSAVFQVGRFEVSVSNVFERGEVCVFSGTIGPEARKCRKTFFGNSPETVVSAIRWAQRAEKRARAAALASAAFGAGVRS